MVIDKIIYMDIPLSFSIEEPALLESIFSIISNNSGITFDYDSIANDLKRNRKTISNYILYLEKAFLIKKLYNYSKNKRKVEVKLKRYYPAINSIFLSFKDESFTQSKVFETMLVNQLDADFFWRDPFKHEVDAVIVDKEIIPIEIKYGKIDTDGMRAFIRKFKTSKNYIISSDIEKEEVFDGKKIQVIPAHIFLLTHLEQLK